MCVTEMSQQTFVALAITGLHDLSDSEIDSLPDGFDLLHHDDQSCVNHHLLYLNVHKRGCTTMMSHL